MELLASTFIASFWISFCLRIADRLGEFDDTVRLKVELKQLARPLCLEFVYYQC